MDIPKIIIGNYHKDKRGKISFVNDFALDRIKRFYVIENQNKDVIRAWQGHMNESKYFYVTQGSYKIVILKPQKLNNVDKALKPEIFILQSSNPMILRIPKSYINGLQSMSDNSMLIVFSDTDLTSSKEDDYRWEIKYFDCYKEVFYDFR